MGGVGLVLGNRLCWWTDLWFPVGWVVSLCLVSFVLFDIWRFGSLICVC